jgi:hypothetical protein
LVPSSNREAAFFLATRCGALSLAAPDIAVQRNSCSFFFSKACPKVRHGIFRFNQQKFLQNQEAGRGSETQSSLQSRSPRWRAEHIWEL